LSYWPKTYFHIPQRQVSRDTKASAKKSTITQ